MLSVIKKLFTKIKDQPHQNFKNTVSSTKYMLRFIWNFEDGKKYIFLKSLESILTAVLPLALVFMPGLIINELTGERRIDILLIYVGITTGIPLMQSVIISSLSVYLSDLRYNFMIKVKINFISHCADMDYETMENPDMELLKERAEETMADSLNTFQYLSDLISAVISVVTCAAIISILTPFILVLVIIVFVLNYYNNKWVNNKTFLMNKEISKYNRYGWPIVRYFSDLKYAKEIRLYHLKDYFSKLYSDKRIEAGKFGIKTSIYQKRSAIIGAIVSFIQTCTLYIYFIYQVIEGKLAVGSMTIYMGIVLQFTSSLSNITRHYLDLSMLSLRVQELIKFMQIPLKNFNTGSQVPFFDSNSVIEFKNVSFKYPGSEKYALENMNIKIHGSQKLCIVGANGSGKSTFIKLLTRLYIPSEGEILLNGININEYDYCQYIRLFAPVFQDFALYNISLGENIVMAEKYDSEHLASVVKQSGLSQFVNNNKNGYDSIIYKWFDIEGIEPSGGEGQRIAIARALYKGGEIFLLDEPTAALDPTAEYEIYTQFHDMINKKAAVIITHRLSAVQLADKVAVFDSGHVVEYGTHKELYAKSGVYTEMFDTQAHFYRDTDSENETDTPSPIQEAK